MAPFHALPSAIAIFLTLRDNFETPTSVNLAAAGTSLLFTLPGYYYSEVKCAIKELDKALDAVGEENQGIQLAEKGVIKYFNTI